MIASLTGTLEYKALDRIVLSVGGVGYEVWLSAQTLAALPQPGAHASILCHTHVREDALQLFGFATDTERTAFELLIAVSGVGPKLALTILSGMNVKDLTRAIIDGDHRRLQSIPGVGKKTAERLVVELRDRFERILARQAAEGSEDSTVTQSSEEVVTALVNLGYRRNIAEKAVQTVVKRANVSNLSSEAMLREALSAIASQ